MAYQKDPRARSKSKREERAFKREVRPTEKRENRKEDLPIDTSSSSGQAWSQKETILPSGSTRREDKQSKSTAKYFSWIDDFLSTFSRIHVIETSKSIDEVRSDLKSIITIRDTGILGRTSANSKLDGKPFTGFVFTSSFEATFKQGTYHTITPTLKGDLYEKDKGTSIYITYTFALEDNIAVVKYILWLAMVAFFISKIAFLLFPIYIVGTAMFIASMRKKYSKRIAEAGTVIREVVEGSAS